MAQNDATTVSQVLAMVREMQGQIQGLNGQIQELNNNRLVQNGEIQGLTKHCLRQALEIRGLNEDTRGLNRRCVHQELDIKELDDCRLVQNGEIQGLNRRCLHQELNIEELNDNRLDQEIALQEYAEKQKRLEKEFANLGSQMIKELSAVKCMNCAKIMIMVCESCNAAAWIWNIPHPHRSYRIQTILLHRPVWIRIRRRLIRCHRTECLQQVNL